jgi:UDP-N-acetylglucosamine 2-epimerase (non-hydrolysing)
MCNCSLIVTDSGGIQEETTYLAKPCITLRDSTERPITVTEGSNYLLPEYNSGNVMSLVDEILAGKTKSSKIPALWDGKAAFRIKEILREKLTS